MVDPTREEALQVDLEIKSDCNPSSRMQTQRRRVVAGAKPIDGKMGRNPRLMMVFRLGQNGVLGSLNSGYVKYGDRERRECAEQAALIVKTLTQLDTDSDTSNVGGRDPANCSSDSKVIRRKRYYEKNLETLQIAARILKEPAGIRRKE
ncbi:hypothetical protein JTB14_007822 [Gonioctena quinquepunctata]|nr:hypothetical protein JTB14_007822 [Gonioctena quinquepunctata]